MAVGANTNAFSNFFQIFGEAPAKEFGYVVLLASWVEMMEVQTNGIIFGTHKAVLLRFYVSVKCKHGVDSSLMLYLT